MLPQLRDQVGAPDDDPGLRPAEQLVARARHEVGALGERVDARTARRAASRCSCSEQPGADVEDERARPLGGDRGQVFDGRRRREADHAVVAGVDLEDRAGPFAERRPVVVARVRFVVPTSTSFAPDADMMSGIRNSPPISISSPRETSDLLAARERRKGEQERGGAVVHDERVLGSGQRDQHRLGAGARFPRARSRDRSRGPSRSGRRPGDGARAAVRQRRPPQVRVQDDARSR